MKLLLLGSGGREHALAWKIAQSPKLEKLYIAPGNAGTNAVGENVNIKATDFPALKKHIQLMRKELLDFSAEEGEADDIIQVNIQLFPVTRGV